MQTQHCHDLAHAMQLAELEQQSAVEGEKVETDTRLRHALDRCGGGLLTEAEQKQSWHIAGCALLAECSCARGTLGMAACASAPFCVLRVPSPCGSDASCLLYAGLMQ